MAGAAALVLVWLGANEPDARMKAALDDWAARHGVTLEAPREETFDGGEATKSLADRCDADLDAARDQKNAGDLDGARQTLARIEQMLREHPELPQAAWLMAERCRLEAQIVTRLGRDERPWQARADALEGERAAAFGETVSSPHETDRIEAAVVVHGAREHATYWDGKRADDRASVARGEHHLAIARGRRIAWSGWVSVLSPGAIDVWVADAPPCSSEDLEGAALGSDSDVRASSGARCPSWVAASPGARPGTMRLARCSADTCEPSSTIIYEWPSEAKPPGVGSRGFPAWAAWTVAGVGVAAATSVILWTTGAFDRKEPARRVIYDGTNL